MKKQLQKLLVLVLVLAFVMGGCAGGDKETAADTTAESTEKETYEPLEAPIAIEDITQYVVLGQYKNLEIVKNSAELTDNDIAEAIKMICEANAEPEQLKEGVIKDGDTVNIDFVGKLDGVAFEGGTGNSDLTIGSNQFIDGFEDGLIGVEVGATVDLNLTFPEDYKSKDLAGKAVVFTVTVNYMHGEDVIPEFDDALAEKLKYEDTEEMREELIDMLKEEKETLVQSEYENAIWETVIANAKITRHEELYDDYYSNYIAQYETMASYYGMTLDQYIEAAGSSTKEFYSIAEEYAEVCMNQELLCRAIAASENMTVTDEEYAKTLSEYYTQYKDSFADEAALEAYYGEERLKNDILWTRAMELVEDSVVVIEGPAEDMFAEETAESGDAEAETTAAAE